MYKKYILYIYIYILVQKDEEKVYLETHIQTAGVTIQQILQESVLRYIIFQYFENFEKCNLLLAVLNRAREEIFGYF